MDFIDGLKESKHVYAECPSCKFIFSLFNARLMYGKNPPKDLLTKSERQAKMALDKLESFEAKYDDDMGDLIQKRNISEDKLKIKLIKLMINIKIQKKHFLKKLDI